MIRCVSYSLVLPLLFALLLAPLSSLPAFARDQATITRVVTFGASSPLMKSETYENREIGLLQNFLEFLLSWKKPLLLSR
jgi:hypothetical protein